MKQVRNSYKLAIKIGRALTFLPKLNFHNIENNNVGILYDIVNILLV